MSGKGYGFCDNVQAPLTLITAFLRRASSSTFGRSAQGCGGAGVVAIDREGGDEDRTVYPELVLRRQLLLARGAGGPVRHAAPRPLRRIRLIGVDLGIDDHREATGEKRSSRAAVG